MAKRRSTESAIAVLAMGVHDTQVRRVEQALGRVACDTCTDRSVLGSLNQMRVMLEGRIEEI